MSPKETVALIGPSGLGGSWTCVELLNRGYKVVGISRNPTKIGEHRNYKPRSIDLHASRVEQIAETLRDVDVIVSCYGPHTAGVAAMRYKPFLETIRKIILASKMAKCQYFIMIGGAGSLYLPGTTTSGLESEEWWIAYWRAMADSEAHTAYLTERFGGGEHARGPAAYRAARIALLENNDNPEAQKVREEHEWRATHNDTALDLITACRTALMFFDGNTSFRWTFLSPSVMYRPGRRTGTYKTQLDYIPLKDDVNLSGKLEGRFLGISAADLALAVVDEVENQRFGGKHWTVWGHQDDDEIPPRCYVDLSMVTLR